MSKRKDTRELRVQQVIGGLVSSQPISPEAVSSIYGISKSTAESIIREAEERLAKKADTINKSAEIGKAINQCEELYRLALTKKDLRNALAIRSELTRLLQLQDTQDTANGTDEGEIERTRKALESLGIHEEENLPLDELARRIVLYILAKQQTGEIR